MYLIRHYETIVDKDVSCHPFCNQTSQENRKCDTLISYFVFSFTVEKICENISYEDLLFKTATSLRLTERLVNNFDSSEITWKVNTKSYTRLCSKKNSRKILSLSRKFVKISLMRICGSKQPRV